MSCPISEQCDTRDLLITAKIWREEGKIKKAPRGWFCQQRGAKTAKFLLIPLRETGVPMEPE